MQAQSADGVVHDFPDGTDPSVIDRVMKQYATQAPSKPIYSGSILPISKDAQGNVSFDSNAGLLGMAKRMGQGALSAATLPGDVYSGKTQMEGPDGQVSPEVIKRAADLAAIASPVNPAVRAGESAIPGISAMRPQSPVIPTTEQLKAAGASDINAAKQSGLDIAAPAIGDYSRQIQQKLFDSGIHPVDAPNTYAKLKELENAPVDSVTTAANLQSFRESLGNTAQNFNPNAAKDQLAASRAIKQLDQFLPSVAPQDVLAGTPATTQALFERGRGNYAAAMRSNDLTGVLDRANTGIIDRAENRAQAANSGRNLDNTIRSKIASLLEKPKEVSGFSDEELSALQNVVDGSGPRNTARYIGNLLGGGGGLGQSMIGTLGAGAGAVSGGVPGAILGGVVPAAIGATSKTIANALAKKSINTADELIRQRSPLFQDAAANPSMAALSPARRSAFIRALMLSNQQQQ
jgi:hypothetical protein